MTETESSAEMVNTTKFRIVLAVDANGAYAAAGVINMSDDEMIDSVVDFSEEPYVVHFIEGHAPVPRPIGSTLTATVNPER